MAYCKFCGMESNQEDKCEWCGKVLFRPASVQEPPPMSTIEVVEQAEAVERKGRITFIVVCSCLLVIAAVVVALRYSYYPGVTWAMLFTAGMLLRYFLIIPAFEDEWEEMLIPGIMLVLLPASVVYVLYMVWGLMNRSIDFTIIWILSVYAVIATVLQIVFIIAAPSEIGFYLWMRAYVTQVLGLVAIFGGWACSNIITPLHK